MMKQSSPTKNINAPRSIVFCGLLTHFLLMFHTRAVLMCDVALIAPTSVNYQIVSIK